jgi:putative RNA 2'-phosphotransferase
VKSETKYRIKSLSKLMEFALRYRPDEFGLILDEDGYVSIKDLLQALKEEEGWSYLKIAHIEEVIRGEEGRRFEVLENRIRSKYGGDITLPNGPVEPPNILFHGAKRKAYPFIIRDGLKPTTGNHVLLFTSREMAIRIGKRRDPEPVILEVKALDAFREGINFYRSNELIYLASGIPSRFISGPRLNREAREKNRPMAKAFYTPPGSFYLDIGRELKLLKMTSKRKRRFLKGERKD